MSTMMVNLSDQEFLLREQYKDSSNLNARIQLHRRFSTNPYDWQRWVFDHFQLPPDAKVLELGCGPGDLWLQNLERIPPGWEVTLSDFSPGMLDQARSSLGESSHPFAFRQMDAQEIAYGDASLDAVVANHMLYHVPNREKALAEIQRVLKPGGCLLAATNGEAHMQELHELLRRCLPRYKAVAPGASQFGLENGTRQLMPWFPTITLHIYADDLLVTELEPLLAYVRSTKLWAVVPKRAEAKLRRLASEELAREGVIRITKSSGLFQACKAGQPARES